METDGLEFARMPMTTRVKRRGDPFRERPGAVRFGMIGIAASIGFGLVGFLIALLNDGYRAEFGIGLLGWMVFFGAAAAVLCSRSCL